MAQLHLYLPDDVAKEVKQRAKSRGLTVSAYLAELVRTQMTDQWPKDFFVVVADIGTDEMRTWSIAAEFARSVARSQLREVCPGAGTME